MDYIKATNFAVKDGLPAGNPAKIVKGTEIDVEFNAIQTSIATKADETGTLAQFAATTSAQLAGVISDETGSGALVFSTSPTLVTPALGTPASGVLTNCTGTAAGLTAGNVTTNANLTGVVTSIGNATSIADAALSIAKTSGLQTALDAKQPLDAALTALSAGSDFVQFTGPLTTTKVFTLPNANSTLATLAGVETFTNKSISGSQITSAVANATLAANVTTNANLTGHVTSIGNAAVLGSFTHSQLNTAISDANVAAAGANTDITSLNAPALGAATATTQTYGDNSTKVATTAFVTSATSAGGTSKIQPISASVAANALTISASALTLDFRSTTLGSGVVTTVSGTPANLVISSGSTLGTTNAVQSRIVVIALNNAGTIELAAVNIAGGTNLDETGLISTTAEGGAGAADSATVVYSTTARTNVAYRVIGYIESTQATAGAWATAPSTIQGYGGQALATMSALGYGQTWQTFTSGSRAIGTTYYNTTGKPIEVFVQVSGSNIASNITVNGVLAAMSRDNTTSAITGATAIVPPGASYVGTGGTWAAWNELR